MAKPTVTQVKTLALIKYAEEHGWKVKTFESGSPTFFKKRPRFVLYLVREVNNPWLTLYSMHLFIGSGRVSGVARMAGFGKPHEIEIGNWSDAQSAAFSFGIPTAEDRRRLEAYAVRAKSEGNQQ